jgi:hypothetical protein
MIGVRKGCDENTPPPLTISAKMIGEMNTGLSERWSWETWGPLERAPLFDSPCVPPDAVGTRAGTRLVTRRARA